MLLLFLTALVLFVLGIAGASEGSALLGLGSALGLLLTVFLSPACSS